MSNVIDFTNEKQKRVIAEIERLQRELEESKQRIQRLHDLIVDMPEDDGTGIPLDEDD